MHVQNTSVLQTARTINRADVEGAKLDPHANPHPNFNQCHLLDDSSTAYLFRTCNIILTSLIHSVELERQTKLFAFCAFFSVLFALSKIQKDSSFCNLRTSRYRFNLLLCELNVFASFLWALGPEL